MKKFSIWLYDTVSGIFICNGIAVSLWLIVHAISGAPAFSFTNITFLFEVISLFWVLNFIFHFISPVITKGILHSIICFMLSMILFLINYGFVPSSKAIILSMVIFFSVYALLLWGNVKLSRKINCPLRHVPQWLMKLRPQFLQKNSDEL